MIGAGALPALTDLTLHWCIIVDGNSHGADNRNEAFKAQSLLPTLTRLTRLRLARAYVSGPASLRPLRGAALGRLVELRASFVHVDGEALGDLLSSSLPALRKLWLCYHDTHWNQAAEEQAAAAGATAAAAAALAAAPWAAALEVLTLFCRGMPDVGVAALAAGGFTALRRLALLQTAATGAALAELAASPAVVAGHLNHLALGSCNPEFGRDESAWAALAAAPLPALRELCVGISPDNTWRGACALARAAWLPQLGSFQLLCGVPHGWHELRLDELPEYVALQARGAIRMCQCSTSAAMRELGRPTDAAGMSDDESGLESGSISGSEQGDDGHDSIDDFEPRCSGDEGDNADEDDSVDYGDDGTSDYEGEGNIEYGDEAGVCVGGNDDDDGQDVDDGYDVDSDDDDGGDDEYAISTTDDRGRYRYGN